MLGKFYAYRTKDIRGKASKRKIIKTAEKEWLLVYENTEQAILTSEQFYALKEKFQRNRENSPRNTKHWYPPLRSIIFCSCNRRMTGFTAGGKYGKPKYRCLACGREIKAIPLWEEIKAGIRQRLLQPERLVPAIKAQLDSGESIARVEEDLKLKRQRLEMLNRAEQKAVRLYLVLPDYSEEKVKDEVSRIVEQRRQLEGEESGLENQLQELRQAVVDEEGLRRFCEIVNRNLDGLNDDQWRILLETMKVKVLVNDAGVTVRMAVPFNEEQTSVIAEQSSRCLYNGNY
jgi:DNA-directed RNA polymerase subunit N (RpoN/RPB10)